jgi:hypothetical protein
VDSPFIFLYGGREMKGIVSSIRPLLRSERLKALAHVRVEEGKELEAFMPDRELAAVLPRSILLGGKTKASPALLGTIQPILSRMAEGREVRVWKYKERFFFSFMPWKSVRFLET